MTLLRNFGTEWLREKFAREMKYLIYSFSDCIGNLPRGRNRVTIISLKQFMCVPLKSTIGKKCIIYSQFENRMEEKTYFNCLTER